MSPLLVLLRSRLPDQFVRVLGVAGKDHVTTPLKAIDLPPVMP